MLFPFSISFQQKGPTELLCIRFLQQFEPFLLIYCKMRDGLATLHPGIYGPWSSAVLQLGNRSPLTPGAAPAELLDEGWGVGDRSGAGPAPFCPPSPPQKAFVCMFIFISHLLAL